MPNLKELKASATYTGQAPVSRIPLGYGGFNRSQSVFLFRNGELIAVAEGWPVTFVGDRQRRALPDENRVIQKLARPGDVIVAKGRVTGNGGWEWVRIFEIVEEGGNDN